jgi:hypothetical protein
MFNISPSKKEDLPQNIRRPVVPINPVIKWTTERNFIFAPALTIEDRGSFDYPRFKHIREEPKLGSSTYNLISQYNPWLDCEMTRERRVYLRPRVGEFSCAVNNSASALDSRCVSNFFRNETIIDIVNLYLWPLLHSRAEEVVACRTFADWKTLFSNTINIAFPDYEYWVSISAASGGSFATVSTTFIPIFDQRRTTQILKYISAERILYLLTTRANFWPYGPPDPRSSQQYGICSVKPKIKEYNDKTKIDWLVGADFLRKMKRVHMYFTSQTSQTTTTAVSSNIYEDDE